MCSVAMNFSKLAICFIVRICVRCRTVSSEQGTSGATTYSFASMSGGAHGRSDIGGVGAGFRLAVEEFSTDELADVLGEVFKADADAGTRLVAGGSAALSTATSPACASFVARGSAGKSRITLLKVLRASASFRSD